MLREEQYSYSWYLNTTHQLSLVAVTVEKPLLVANCRPPNILSSLTLNKKLASDIVYLLYRTVFYQRLHGGKGVTDPKFDYHTSKF